MLLEKVKELTQRIVEGNLTPEEEADLRDEIKDLQLSIVLMNRYKDVLEALDD